MFEFKDNPSPDFRCCSCSAQPVLFLLKARLPGIPYGATLPLCDGCARLLRDALRDKLAAAPIGTIAAPAPITENAGTLFCDEDFESRADDGIDDDAHPELYSDMSGGQS